MKRMGVLLIGLMLLSALRSWARVFIVSEAEDSISIRSLRGAIIAANRSGGRNTILLRGATRLHSPRSVFHLTISGALEDHALTGDLDIIGNLAIMGTGPDTIIDAASLGDRVFHVLPGGGLSLSKITVRGGKAPDPRSPVFSELVNARGGAIYNAGKLTLQECVLTNNSSGEGTPNTGHGENNPGGDGGAIYNSGMLSINKSVIIANSGGDGFDGSEGGNGGGINNDGQCVLNRCSITSNRGGDGGTPVFFFSQGGGAGGDGAGIFNTGTMFITKCVVNKNKGGRGGDGVIGMPGSGSPFTGRGGWGGNGGGIANIGKMEISYSAIYGNVCGSAGKGGSSGDGGIGGLGGGLVNAGTLTMVACTISSNLCGNGGDGGDGLYAGYGNTGGSGGGIYGGGPLTLTSCTVVLNRSGNGGNGGIGHPIRELIFPPGNGGNAGFGGGVVTGSASDVTIRNTLIALNLAGVGGQPGTNILDPDGTGTPVVTSGNFGVSGKAPDIYGDFALNGFNLIGIVDDSGHGFGDGETNDIVGSSTSPIDPLLAPLEMNGGLTPTHALLPGSPAIDRGNSFKIHKDQRGVKRPYNDASLANATDGDGSDIGAFEVIAPKRPK